MIGIIASGITGGLLGFNGYTWDQGIFWAVLIPVSIVFTFIDVKLRSNII